MSDGKVYSFYLLAKKVKANNTTVKKNCAFLHTIGLIRIDEVSSEESASGTPSYRVTIAENGLKSGREHARQQPHTCPVNPSMAGGFLTS